MRGGSKDHATAVCVAVSRWTVRGTPTFPSVAPCSRPSRPLRLVAGPGQPVDFRVVCKKQGAPMVSRRMLCLAPLVVSLGACAVSRPPRIPMPLISTTDVHSADFVEAAKGNEVLGKIEFAERDDEVVRYFSQAKNQALYTRDPKRYPDRGVGIQLAQMGSDPVLRLPNGVHDPVLGALQQGDPAIWKSNHNGANFTFSGAKVTPKIY